MKLAENKYGTGGIKNKIDLRDKKWHKLAMASTPFDWDKGYDVEEELRVALKDPNFKLPIKDQNGSSSCCGQAGSYYEEVQDAFEKGVFTEKSARDIYSQIYYPNGGSTTRDILNLLTKKGSCKETLLASYDHGTPPSEAFMRNRTDASDITAVDANTARGTSYAMVNLTIDQFAQAIRDNHGLVFGIDGEDNGTWLSKFPRPPQIEVWGHELYAAKAKLINGRKFIGFANSWGASVGDAGWQWVSEDYFPHMHSAGVLYDNTNDILKQEVTLLEQLLALLQRLYNNLRGSDTKLLVK